MRIVRFQYQEEIFFGELKNNQTINLFEGPPWPEIKPTSRTVDLTEARLLAPVSPPDLIAIGLNYREHARESGAEEPKEPVVFFKSTASVIGHEETIRLPRMAPDEVDYEAELAIVIGRECRHVRESDVHDYILGFACANDVSARDCQRRRDVQWARAKSFETFCPLGPWVETELDPSDLEVKLYLNDQTMQRGRTSDMIFDWRRLVSFCSEIFTLRPGTVIISGTPPGVGFARRPPVFLRSGDRVEVEIEGIGKLSNQVESE